jgi:ZIP family zinc transporter
MVQENLLLAFSLTAIAGLCTGIGSAFAFFAKRTNKTFLSVSLGFSAGVMIYVSFVEIFTKSQIVLAEVHGQIVGAWLTATAFFAGVFFIAVIDRLLPSYENPHEAHAIEEMRKPAPAESRLMRMGLFTALAIGIHNFPEGLATFFGALSDPGLGIAITVAIAIHNIPEGISVSVPVYFATGSKKKAFWFSFLSGVSEPVGSQAFLHKKCLWPVVRRRGRHHGIHLPGRVTPYGQGIWEGTPGHLRPDCRHGGHGGEPFAFYVT